MSEDDEPMFDFGINSILVVYRCGCRDGMRGVGPLLKGPRCMRHHAPADYGWSIEWPGSAADLTRPKDGE